MDIKEKLEKQGLRGLKKIYWNLDGETLCQEALTRGEAKLSQDGPLVVTTGKYTGRSPNDKFIVKEPSSDSKVDWGQVNLPISEEHFNRIYEKVLNYVKGRDLFVQDCYIGADPKYRVPLRVVTEFAWQSLFAQNMFIRVGDPKVLEKHTPEYTIIAVPDLKADPKTDGTHSEVFILVHFGKKLILIGGTHYAGEIKKSAFSLLNYLLPQKGILSMHCSANVGKDKDVAIFFGLSGTGKTTLSADPHRRLIGDDEHAWSSEGVFNYEGGCYAKVIHLSKEAEPEIYATTQRQGTLLENVVMDAGGHIDLNDDSLTENTRGSYPLEFIPNVEPSGMAGHPNHVIMLTCDAFGVLPPVARLSQEQAEYYFLLGYTSKVAGTERGIKEPQMTFSPCFGAPFMTLHPKVYGRLLHEKLGRYKAQCWLVNTGWSGGAYGVGKRFAIKDSRAIINAILSNTLSQGSFHQDPHFGFEIPNNCPGISSQEILDPRKLWQDKGAYDKMVEDLAEKFRRKFEELNNRKAA